MSFSSYEFIFVFYPLVLMIYYIICHVAAFRKYRLHILSLVVASVIFLANADMESVICLCFSLLVNYAILNIMSKTTRKIVLYVGIIFNVVFLMVFKYAYFTIENVNILFRTNYDIGNIVLPVGISFYTFQQILLLFEYGKTEGKKLDLIDYVAVVSFFPRLVSGPILTYQNVQTINSELVDADKVKYSNLSAGFYLFCIGLFKKIVIADTLDYFVDNGYGIAESINFWQAWTTALCYTLQIYFDFSGYSDMAIGIARTFGVTLPINFNSPYRSESITDFWRRWHITLSKSLSQLIYIPLGGNRKGNIRTYCNLMITFLVSGLWHGASWTFVVWGGLHGFFMVLERSFKTKIQMLPHVVRCAVTFLIVNFLWVFFRADSIRQAFNVIKAMLSLPINVSIKTIGTLADDGIIPFSNSLWALYVIIIEIILIIWVNIKRNSNDMYSDFKPNKPNLTVAIILFVISVLHLSKLASFVYLNF